MRFEYQIPMDVYVACQLLHYKVTNPNHARDGLAWMALGSGFILVAWIEGRLGWAPVLLALTGAWFVYCAFGMLFLKRHYRRAYRSTNVAGETYIAEVRSDGFDVRHPSYSWSVQWSAVQVKAEADCALMLASECTIFMWGKQYLTEEQQEQIRLLAGL
jgi:hypothetical protein